MTKKKSFRQYIRRLRPIVILIAGILLTAGIVLSCIFSHRAAAEGTLEIHFLDVGQGDSAFLCTSAGNALIDTGEADARQFVHLSVQPYGSRLEYLIITHPHSDHMGGASYILEKMEVGTVVLPRSDTWDDGYASLLGAVSKSGASVLFAVPGLEFSLGDARFTVLAPLDQYGEENDRSAVIRMDFGKTSALFTGDAEQLSEADQLREYAGRDGGLLNTDILKVGHHGSSTSSSYPYLWAVSPEYAVISCGKNNSYGHPAADVIKRLETIGAKILRTDRLGTVRIVTDGKTITVSSDNQANP